MSLSLSLSLYLSLSLSVSLCLSLSLSFSLSLSLSLSLSISPSSASLLAGSTQRGWDGDGSPLPNRLERPVDGAKRKERRLKRGDRELQERHQPGALLSALQELIGVVQKGHQHAWVGNRAHMKRLALETNLVDPKVRGQLRSKLLPLALLERTSHQLD